MKIKVNGEESDFDNATTVATLLAAIGVETRGVAVEVNGEIVPRAAHGATPLKDGDTLEVVRMTGGG